MDRRIVIFCSLLLLHACVQGMSIFGRGRCRCRGVTDKFDLRSFATFEVFKPTTYCDKFEILVTLKKSRKEICLNPDSKSVRRILTEMRKKRAKK
ncbi:hypothetical protein FKM82_000957 [Ascaphus truei]